MAKEETIAAHATKDMFEKTEIAELLTAARLYEKTLRRKIANEPNEAIKKIHSETLSSVIKTINTLQGM